MKFARYALLAFFSLLLIVPAAQAQPMFSAGAGRAAYLSLNVKL